MIIDKFKNCYPKKSESKSESMLSDEEIEDDDYHLGLDLNDNSLSSSDQPS